MVLLLVGGAFPLTGNGLPRPLLQEYEDGGSGISRYNGGGNRLNESFFAYFNLRFIDLKLAGVGDYEMMDSPQFNLNIRPEIDLYIKGGFLLNLYLDASLIGEKYFAPSFGVGFAFIKDFRREWLKQVIVSYWRTVRYLHTRTETRQYYGKAANLHTLEAGMKFITKWGFESNGYNNTTASVLGSSVNNIDWVTYRTDGRLFYVGYRFLAMRQLALTSDELIFYARFLWGELNKTATVYDWFDNSNTTTVKRTDQVIGWELSLDWNILFARGGSIDGKPFFTFGFRLGFQTGM